MSYKLILVISLPLLVLMVPAALGDGHDPWEDVECGAGPRDQSHEFAGPPGSRLRVRVDLLCDVEASGQATTLPTDCASTDSLLLSYRWNHAYALLVDASKSGLSGAGVVSAFASSVASWDDATNASLSGGVSAGGSGAKAGRLDGVNQIGWKSLAARTIAQTTTWYSTGTGLASESDGAYNLRYAWSLLGESNRMDVQNIATHEVGHTFGLGHPATVAANACLTMYAYADLGETQKRTLGDGDLLGIRAVYGS